MRMNLKLSAALFAILLLSFVALVHADDSAKKVIAIGDVDTGMDMSGGKSYDLKETIQLGLKKELMKKGFEVKITSSAVTTDSAKGDSPSLPELPTDRAPSQKEMNAYIAAMQKWQKQMTGEVKTHKSVDADAYFDFKVAKSSSGLDTGGAAGTIQDITGVDTHYGDLSTKSEKVFLIATERDPKTGELIDKHTANASNVQFRNVGGITTYDYGTNDVERERLFSSAVKNCAKWIANQVK